MLFCRIYRNKQIIFAKRPSGKLDMSSFRTNVVEPFDWKSVKLEKGDILVRNLLISIGETRLGCLSRDSLS
jgi:NADPH-dependent curcumin reductase CurA